MVVVVVVGEEGDVEVSATFFPFGMMSLIRLYLDIDDHRRGGPRGRSSMIAGGNGYGGGGDRPPLPENTNAKLRKMVVKIGEEEVSALQRLNSIQVIR